MLTAFSPMSPPKPSTKVYAGAESVSHASYTNTIIAACGSSRNSTNDGTEMVANALPTLPARRKRNSLSHPPCPLEISLHCRPCVRFPHPSSPRRDRNLCAP
jgi:hypothetical protein